MLKEKAISSTTIDLSDLSDGKHTVVITVTDSAGNKAVSEIEVCIDEDITAPRDVVEDDLGYNGVVYQAADGAVKIVNGGTLIKGVDLSSVIALETVGTTFTDSDGNEVDVFESLAAAGVNYVRVLAYADDSSVEQIAARAAAAGLSLYVVFVCADTGNTSMTCPTDWASDKESSLTSYITSTLTSIQNTGVVIGMVSIGYEVNSSSDFYECTFMGETGSDIISPMAAGIEAVRTFDTDIMVALNLSGDNLYFNVAAVLNDLDFDVTVVSTCTGGTVSDMYYSLTEYIADYGKMVLIEYTDGNGNIEDAISKSSEFSKCIGSIYTTDNLVSIISGDLSAFSSNGSDVNTPIDVALAQVQQITVTDEDEDGADDNGQTYDFRLVGQLNREIVSTNDNYDPVEDVGFRVFVYDEKGNVLKNDAQTYDYSDRMTTVVYNKIIANGYSVTPLDNNLYFYTYRFNNIPTGSVYYFEVRSNADDIEYCAYYQRASKYYAVYNGHAAVIDSDDVGTLSGNDVIALEAATNKAGSTDNEYGN